MFLWTTPLLVPAVQRALNMPLVTAGAFVTVLLTTGGFGLIFANPLIRRTSLRLIAAVGGLAAIGALTLLGLGGCGVNRFVLAALVGLGCGFIMATVDPSAARLAVPERALSVAGATNTIIAAAAFVIIPLALANLGARWIFWCHAAMAAVGVPLLLRVLPKARFTRPVRPDIGPPGGRASPIAMVLSAHTLYSLGMGSYWAFLEAAGFSAGLSATSIGLATSLATILSLFAPIAAAFMGARLGRAWPLALGTIGFGLTSAATLLSKGALGFTLALTLASAGIVFIPGFLGGVLIAFDRTGRAANMASAIGFLLNGAGPALGALITARFGLGGLAVAVVAMCTGAGVLELWPAFLADRFSRGLKTEGLVAVELDHGMTPRPGSYQAA